MVSAAKRNQKREGDYRWHISSIISVTVQKSFDLYLPIESFTIGKKVGHIAGDIGISTCRNAEHKQIFEELKAKSDTVGLLRSQVTFQLGIFINKVAVFVMLSKN